MSAVNDWINQDPRRSAPEFDFGSMWTSEHAPNTDWTVTYNTGTGELYARTRTGHDIEVLGQFAAPQDVADALPDWGRRSQQAGSLDWVRREALALRNTPEIDNSDPIYGIVLNTNGTTLALLEPQTIGTVATRLGDHLDVSTVNTGNRTDRVIMWVDDFGHDKHLAVNAAATQLYGTGWPVLGDVVVVTDDRRPLPAALARSLIPDLDTPDRPMTPEHGRVGEALDWDDRLDDIEANHETIGFDLDDLELDALARQPEPTLKPETAEINAWLESINADHQPEPEPEPDVDVDDAMDLDL